LCRLLPIAYSLLPVPLAVRYSIKNWPNHDRPRERLLTLGPRALSPRELLALLIETGHAGGNGGKPRSALDLAGDLLRWASPAGGPESLRRIMTAPVSALCTVPGIGPAKAGKILAGLDLGRRATEEARPERERINGPRDVYNRMWVAMRDLPQEEFHVLLLNTQNEVIRDVVVTRGTLDASLVHPREVFRPAMEESASTLILVHNHPSGEPTPSSDDRIITLQLATAGRMLGIPVVDHVIIGEGRYVSFVESGILEG
jgi:DNA repair protein RadC